MKDFPKFMLASALGFVLASIVLSVISMFFFFITLGSAISTMGEEQFRLEDKSVLNLKLAGSIEERSPADDPFTSFMSDDATAVIGLDEIVAAIRKAKENDKIKGIYLDSRVFSASLATLAEIRGELVDFKESGKFIYSYADTYSQPGYYLASVADKITINPEGMLDIHGFASTPVFYKDALQKLGIEMQVFKVGTYKSAVEPFILNEMSDANREQVNSYLTDMWRSFGKQIAESRNMSMAQIDSIANQSTIFKDVNYLVTSGLVDTVVYETEMKNYLRAQLDLEKDAKIPSATVKDMMSVKRTVAKKSNNRIALLYAVGNITSGSGSQDIQDKFVVNEIEKLRKDKNVKAVVFRINSGGGSAYASEQIWKAINDLKAEKPVVVSMGDLAASGGYYIACNADKIIAQPTTITGSIGIFGLIPNVKGTTDKLGLDVDVVKTHDFGDFGNITRPMNEREKEMIQTYVNRGYDSFLSRCAEGRGIPKDTLAKYAEGRVWTGNQALKIGLVDELGNIDDAVSSAAELASLGDDYLVYEYPKKRSIFEELFDTKKTDLAAKTLKQYLGNSYDIFMTMKNIKDGDIIQARMPYDVNIY